MNATESIVRDVVAERQAQDAKWGPNQNHPDGTGGAHRVTLADNARRACNRAADHGVVTWQHILWEEVTEAFAETEPDLLRNELIQVAAVAVKWVEDIDRRTNPADPPDYDSDTCDCGQCTCQS